MSSFHFMWLIVFLAIPTNAVPPRTPDELQDHLVDIRTTLGAVTSQLEKFNALYLNKLETRMVVAASVLSSLEAKVNNVVERSHAWDTFQLHVASWNEQMHTINNKMDILGRGQEEQAQLEARLSILQSLDYKLDRLGLRLEDMDRRLNVLSKERDTQRENPIVGEFAARGLLTTLKAVERKVDRVSQLVLERAHKRASRNEGNALRSSGSVETFSNLSTMATAASAGTIATAASAGESPGKIVIRCQTPRAMDELLRDVAAKVDYMFDRTQGRKPEEGESEENGTREEEEEADRNERATRRCEAQSDTAGKLDEIIEAVRELKSSPSVHSVAVDLDRLLRNLSTQTARRAEVVASFCKEQRAYIESALDRRLNPHSLRALIASPSVTSQSSILSSSIKKSSPVSNETSPSIDLEIHGTSPPSFNLGINGTASPPSINGGKNGTTPPSFSISLENETAPPTLTSALPTLTSPTVSTTSVNLKTSCEELAGPEARSGVFKFAVDPWEGHGERDYSERFCDMQTSGGGWTVIHRRGNFGEPRENFTKSWEDYRDGFGDLEREFWFGNDFIHRLTYDRLATLRVELEDFEGNTAWAEYQGFRVGSEDQHFELSLGEYSGNASDSMSAHHGAAFSTVDRNHDLSPPCCPCAQTYGGGWWFRSCFNANLNGVYHTSPEENNYFRGIIWEHWLGDYSLKAASMKVRSSNFQRIT